MLVKLHSQIEPKGVTVERLWNGKKVGNKSAFPTEGSLTLRVRIPQTLGAAGVVCRLGKDGEGTCDFPLTFLSSSLGFDSYEGTLEPAAFCDPNGGLYWFELLFLRGFDTLFTDEEGSLKTENASRFPLLFYAPSFQTPAWFRGGVMYHVFLDRFFRGAGKTELRATSVLRTDWNGATPAYPEKPGDPFDNVEFFGGNLWGVIEKLDFLQSLGVTVLYLSPIFESRSNHRYDTGDYEKIDPFLGGEEAFDALIREAHARGMKVILDGVFNHTGSDSKYFNREGSYRSLGAYQSKRSAYYPWYHFQSFPNDYDCWWGVDILPRLNHETKSCLDYFTGDGGIAEKWIARGADGFRLDVADELSNEFLEAFRARIKNTSPERDPILIGEVWENAAQKISYGERRKYFWGRQLDSVMNYPFRSAVLDLLETGDAAWFCECLEEIYNAYPKCVCDVLMNLLGTHDTPRILSSLGNPNPPEENRELASVKLTEKERRKAEKKLKIASILQFTVYGIPSVYYGDEAGMEGYRDPFCRRPYPWGEEDPDLLAHYRRLGNLRKSHPVFTDGSFEILEKGEKSFLYKREGHGERIVVSVNLSEEPISVCTHGCAFDALNNANVDKTVIQPPKTALVFSTQKTQV